ncbi:MAG: hypothetical protein ACOCRX_10440 [Candidatus Woesearchaeota archaeon]
MRIIKIEEKYNNGCIIIYYLKLELGGLQVNNAKYNSPRKVDRIEVTEERFCKDCEKDKEKCNRNVSQCLKKATLYKQFARIKKNR